MKKSIRTVGPLQSENFEQKLRDYSCLTAAALVTATTASAQIVTLHVGDFTGGSMTIPSLDASSGGNHRVSAPAVPFGPSGRSVYLFGRQQNGLNHPVPGTHSVSGYLSVLIGPIAVTAGGKARNFTGGAGHVINVNPSWQTGGKVFETASHQPGTWVLGGHRAGNFQPVGAGVPATGYVGVRFGTSGNYRYGWLHIQVGQDSNGRPNSIALTPGPNTGDVVGAYNIDLLGSIYAGQVTAIPEPASVATGLALFALGAAGVREHRRRRQLAA